MSQRSMTREDFEEAQRVVRVCEARSKQLQAKQLTCRARGTRVEEAELARRQKELADEQGTLGLLRAGTRPEEIEAAQAQLARLEEERRYLKVLEHKLSLRSTIAGLITTPRLREKVGEYVHEGDVLCVIDNTAALEAEIALDEQEIDRVQTGQRVRLTFRALPFNTFAGRVERIAPAAVKDEQVGVQGRITIYCRLETSSAKLRPDMSGYARISTTRRPVGMVLADRAIRLFSTEFWW
ncbi:MAG: efflux RND transporter periplasmic adaptor subunit [Planctomycetes bacterium]|nr:efflux RND transporter periplasmic adaptor subunit [Planctomycetota bacterium]